MRESPADSVSLVFDGGGKQKLSLYSMDQGGKQCFGLLELEFFLQKTVESANFVLQIQWKVLI
jgi:hypothetical protein